jgi:hypothetical protein
LKLEFPTCPSTIGLRGGIIVGCMNQETKGVVQTSGDIHFLGA